MADGSERPIEDIRLGERVVTAEGNTGRVLRTMLRDEDGGLVRLVLWGHSHLRMTREHPVLTARGYVPAAALKIGDEVALPRYTSETTVTSIAPRDLVRRHKVGSAVLPEKIELDEAFGRLFGLWLAEGSADGTKVRWSYGGHESDTLVPETVELVRTALGVEAHAAPRPNGTWWVTLYGTPWNALFKLLGGDRVESKRPHPLICSGGAAFLSAVLDGWLSGDGHARPNGTTEGVSVSADLALAMYDIAQAIGRHPVLVWSESPQNRHARVRLPRWTLSMAPGKGRCREDDRHVWRKVRELHVEDYVGPVYNLSVEGDESYVAEGVGVHNCTGNAAEGACGTEPLWSAIPAPQRPWPEDGNADEEQAVALYSAATQIDEFDGAYPPDDTGSSGLAVAKAAKAAGLISGYTHCTSLDAALKALSQQPVIAGINWYDSFDYPLPSGFMTITEGAQVRGGHEVCLDELDVENRRVWFTNSWGTGWGAEGRACLSWDDFERLLHEDGDVTVFTPLSQPDPQPTPDPSADLDGCLGQIITLAQKVRDALKGTTS